MLGYVLPFMHKELHHHGHMCLWSAHCRNAVQEYIFEKRYMSQHHRGLNLGKLPELKTAGDFGVPAQKENCPFRQLSYRYCSFIGFFF
jgi:hypothetical protein